jgi:hypothetical protein
MTERLKLAYKLYSETNLFRPGDLVHYKPGLCNGRDEERMATFIVLEVDVSGHEHMRIGFYTKDGTFDDFWVDPKRFKSCTGE